MAINAGEILVRFRADSRTAVREFARFQRALRTTVGDTRTQIKSLNNSINGFAAAAGVGLGAAILRIGSNFDKAITNVRAITKETEDQFESSRAAAIVLASEYGKAADEVGGALFQIVSAGKRGTEAFQALEAATKLSKAGLVDTALATDVLIGSLNAFGLSGDQAEAAAGKLIGTVDRGILTFEQLANKLGNVAPVAAASGLEFEELLGILSTITRQGVNFSQAVTQTRGAIVKLLAPGKAARIEIEKVLGATIEATVAQKGFVGTLEQLVNTAGSSTAVLKKLFEDVEAIQGVQAIVGAGFDSLKSDIKGLNQAGAGTLNQTLDIQSKSFAQLSSELTNLVQNRVVAFFENNEDAIKGTTQAIIDFLRENETFVDIIIGGAAAVAALSTAVLGFKGALFIADGALQIVHAGLTILNTLTGVNSVANTVNTTTRVANVAAVNTQNTSIIAQNKLLAGNTLLLTGNVAAGRKYVANTAASAAATGGFRAILAKHLPTLARLPVIFGTVLAAAKGLVVGLGLLAAKVLVLVGVFAAFFKAGQAIGRMISGNTKEYEEQLKVLREVEKRQASVNRIVQQVLIRSRDTTQEATQATSEYARVQSELAKAIEDTGAGIEGASDRAAELTNELDALRPIAEQSTETLQNRLEEIESQIRRSAEETGLLGESYQGAFTDGGRALAGFGTSLAEIDTLVATLGEAKASAIIAEIKQIKDELSGAAQASRDYEQAQKQSKTATNLLGSAVGIAREAVSEYSDALTGLLERAKGLTQGDFTKTFTEIRDDLIESEDAIASLINKIEDLEETKNILQFKDADPVVIAEAVEEIARLEGELEKAAEAATLFNQALFAEVAEQNREIIEARLEALDEITQKEIESLRSIGNIREADELAAQARRDQSQRRVLEALEEEADRRREIQGIIDEGNLTQQEQEALQLTIERSQALSDLYADQQAAIGEAYDAELDAIIRNDEERQERIAEEEQRRQRLALTEEKAGQARLAIQARINGDLKTELEARQRITEIELELLGIKGLQAEKELELIDTLKDRIELLRQEIKSIQNAGGDLDDAIDASREAQRDTGGTDRVKGGRERIRDNLDDAQTEEGIASIRGAFRDTLESETEFLLKKRQEAQRAGDEELVKEIDTRLREIGEIWNVFMDEVSRRLSEIAEEEAARAAAEAQVAQQAAQQPQTTDTAPEDPDAPINAPEPAGSEEERQGEPSNTPDKGASQSTERLKQEAQRTRQQINKATSQLVAATDTVREAINGLGAEVVTGFGSVTAKLAEMAAQVNENTATIAAQTEEIDRIRIEGR